MKISDLLRNFADTHLLRGIADAVDQQLLQQSETTTPKTEPTISKPSDDGENVDAPDGVFIPPLQQKIEMLKKATGVDNVYDGDEDDDVQEERHSYPDVMNQIRKNAGIDMNTINSLVHDEPLN